MKASIFLGALLTLCAACVADGDSDYPAVVKIGGCTGVCISDSGLVMTARHCGAPEMVVVSFGDRQVNARRVYVGRDVLDAPVVYDCDGDGFPFIPVANAVPKQSERVYYVGYPGGDNANQVRIRGRVRGGTEINGTRANVVDCQAWQGMSGCPLFNGDDELVGLLYGTSKAAGNGDSIWISWGATRAAYEAVVPASERSRRRERRPGVQRPVLYVFALPSGCPGCEEFEHDARRGKFRQFDVRVVIWTDQGWSHPDGKGGDDGMDIAKACRTKTDCPLQAAPTFWIQGADKVREGYKSADCCILISWLDGVVRAVIGVNPEPPRSTPIPPAPHPGERIEPVPDPIGSTPLPPPPAPEKPPEPLPPSTVDWGTVTLAFLCAEVDTTKLGGELRGTALEELQGPAKRRLAEITGQALRFEIVSQRLSEPWFGSVCRATGVEPKPFFVVAFVKKQLKPGLTGNIARKILREKLEEFTSGDGPLAKLKGLLPCDVILEDLHPDDYTKGMDALLHPPELSDEAPEESANKDEDRLAVLKAAIPKLVAGVVRSELKSLPAAPVADDVNFLLSEKNGGYRDWGIISGLAALLGGVVWGGTKLGKIVGVLAPLAGMVGDLSKQIRPIPRQVAAAVQAGAQTVSPPAPAAPLPASNKPAGEAKVT